MSATHEHDRSRCRDAFGLRRCARVVPGRAALAALALVFASAASAQDFPDAIFHNGHVVTVDDQFSIQEAVAVRDRRITAVGASDDVLALAGAQTQQVDLAGRTVIPGLIDNHNHVVRATEYWPNELRLDGVTRREQALTLLADKARTLPAGEWLMTLGGWLEDQFIDSQADFTLAELDALAPDRPAFIQAVYSHAYVNSAWLDAMSLPVVGRASSGSADPGGGAQGLDAYVVRDADGRATGRLNGGFPMVEAAMARFPAVSEVRQTAAIRTLMRDLNRLGLTAVYDPGGVGVRDQSYARIAALAASGELTLRIFHTLSDGVPASREAAQALIDRLDAARPFQGDELFDMIGLGEIYYGPFHWDGATSPTEPGPEDVDAARSILRAAAAHGWPVQTHAIQPQTIDYLLDLMTEINAEFPLRQLRWSITHADNIGAAQIERARYLGMNLQMRSVPVIGGRAPVVATFGEQAFDMPPLALVQRSGIPFGLGTDGTKAAQIDPFVTLWWAVTGRALNGDTILRQTLTREQALIAHTRANAYLIFQEANLGAIRPGLLADMVVLDRDYLRVPADEIKDIRPVATIVGGEVVHGAL